MAMADEVRTPQHFKEKKKKSFSETFIPHKGDSSKELTGKIISLVSIAVLLACIPFLAYTLYEKLDDRQNHKDINFKYIEATKSGDAGVGASDSPELTYSPDETIERKPLEVSPAAAEMLEINPNYAGYIYIPDVMSEAVVQGDDDEYYLTHNFYDKKRSCGTVFADHRADVNDYSDLQSSNITLYGHNQRDGTMFGNMDYYKWDDKYWLKNPFIYFDNKYESGIYVIVSSFIVNTLPEHDDGKVFDYNNYVNFAESGKYSGETFVSEITERSRFNTGIDYNTEDKYLTLSTCSYEFNEARHVIVARKLRPGETTENIDTTNFTVNKTSKWPAIYYKYNGGA